MDSVLKPMRAAWDAGQQAAYARHLRSSSALATAKAIDRETEPPDERGVRKLDVIYGKNSLGLGRRTASAPSMQHCPKELRRELCRERYHTRRRHGLVSPDADAAGGAQDGGIRRHPVRSGAPRSTSWPSTPRSTPYYYIKLDIRNTSIKTWDSRTWIWIFSLLHTAATDEQTFAR